MRKDPDPHNCQERMFTAVSIMVRGGDIRARLRSAFQELLPLRPQDFSEKLRPRFRKIMERMSPRKAATMSGRDAMFRMRNATAERIANEMVQILFALTRGG